MKKFNTANSQKDDFMLNIPFVRVPQEIFCDKKYAKVSASAKYLFMLMLSRFSLSVKNHLVDKDGNVFIYFTCREAMEAIGCSEYKVLKLFGELDCKNGAGLIERKRQGLCRPDIIYLNADLIYGRDDETGKKEHRAKNETSAHDTAESVQKTEFMNNENKSSGTLKIKEPEPLKSKANNINNNYNKNNKIKINNPILPFSQDIDATDWKDYKECIKLKIDYDVLIEDKNKEIVDEIVDAMLNVICSSKDIITISGNHIPQKEVKKRFLAMDISHIEYVYDSLAKNTTDIKNIHAYLLTTLYRASGYINLHYQAKAKHDLKEARERRFG